MAAMSDYLENKLIDHIFRNTAFTVPATLYVGLHTITPTDVGGGTEVSVAGNTYTRVSIPTSLYAFQSTGGTVGAVSAGVSGNTWNANTIQYPAPNNAWGVINGFGIYDANTGGGNLLFYGNLTQAKTVNGGDAAPSFSATALSIQIDN